MISGGQRLWMEKSMTVKREPEKAIYSERTALYPNYGGGYMNLCMH